MIEKIKLVFYNKQENKIPKIPSKTALVNAIYYDLDWSNKIYALEWWSKHGHFNEDLYKNLLIAKLNSINELQAKVKS